MRITSLVAAQPGWTVYLKDSTEGEFFPVACWALCEDEGTIAALRRSWIAPVCMIDAALGPVDTSRIKLIEYDAGTFLVGDSR